jgi:hypothetical protein
MALNLRTLTQMIRKLDVNTNPNVASSLDTMKDRAKIRLRMKVEREI